MRSVRKLVLLAVMAIAVTAAMAPSALAQTTEPMAYAPLDLVVSSEAGTPCPAVTTNPANPGATGEFTTAGGCFVHGGGPNIVVSGHVFGVESVDYLCTWEFDIRIASNATGYITHQEFISGSAGTCTRRPCHYPSAPSGSFVPPTTFNGLHNEAKPWRAYGRETAPNTKELVVLICWEDRNATSLEPASNKRHVGCAIPFTEGSEHRYTFTATPELRCSGTGTFSDPITEINGVFTTEATQVQGPGPTEGTRAHVEINHL